MKGRSATILVSVGLLVLAAGGWIYLQVQAAQEERQRVADLLADLDRELAKERPDGSELSLLVTRIRKIGDPDTDDRLRRALARIEVARGRKEKAWEHLQPLAMAMGREPRPHDQLLGARLLADIHAMTGRARDLRQALQLAEAAHRASGEPTALFLAWQCAQRLGDAEARERLGDRLLQEHPATPQADLVALLRREPEQVATGELRGLATRFERLPIELGMALARAHLFARELPEALRELDVVVQRAPSLVDVRNTAATACYMFVQQAAGASEEEVRRRRAQMHAHAQWLLSNASPDDSRRDSWKTMLESR